MRQRPIPRRTPGNLPSDLSGFVGRGVELAELERLLESSRLVTVTGAGGVGKSRLVLAAARAAADDRSADPAQERHCDGVWLAELASVRDPTLLELTIAEALGLTDHTVRPPRQVLAEHLAERRLLLVLDGFEQLVDETAALVRDLLRGSPGLRVLAAGRRPLTLDGELSWPLAPLDPEEALALLIERASAADPSFSLTEANRAVLAELCARLDGLPLALELAAGRMRTLSPAQVLSRLEDRFALLTGGSRGALPRHRALRTAIGWSHELCTTAERLLWARLSVFAGQFDLDAAEYVCAGPDLPVESVLDLVGELLGQSLLVREETAAGVRYRMLETVRIYGAGWLESTGDAGRLRRRHRDWYMGLATWCELDWFSPRQQEVAALVEAELANLRLALECCLDEPDEVHLGQYLAGTLWFYWAGCGRLTEGRHWLDRSLEAGPGPGEPSEYESSRLKALWVLGYVAALQGDSVASMSALYECRDGAAQSGNPVAAAYAVHRLGCLALVSDDMVRARELLGSALERYREAGELNSNVLMCQVELAMALAFQGEQEGALSLCEEVRDICEERGERWTKAYALYVLAYAALDAGGTAEARRLLSECVAVNHAFRDLVGLVLAVELLALVTVAEGHPAEAALLQGAAEPMWDGVGLRLFGSGYFNAPRLMCQERAGELLGAERYASCARHGRTLGVDALVERALRGPEPAPAPTGPLPRPRAAADRPATRPGADNRKPAGSPKGEPAG
ncbi:MULTISPECIES: AAA family ATPase [unclassified Streptomyces]|uniref:ATP-binding protein n=1 Tax=unclassified Streptomyces TaxID=2593676 RepID=UPI000DC78284|nr:MULTISPECIES: AAA family ATPase [unclassified Streptomyces]AWZ04630.1 regulator [Streptomyces sp. ICC4]AWZ11621.1 regulator [Streptomyces sp. ICC1]